MRLNELRFKDKVNLNLFVNFTMAKYMEATFCQRKHVVRLLVKPPHIEVPADVIRNHVSQN